MCLEELDEIGLGRGGNTHHLVGYRIVERFRAVTAGFSDAAKHFPDDRRAVLFIARVNLLGGEREIEIVADALAVLSEDVSERVVSGTGIDRTLENDRTVVGADRYEAFDGIDHKREIERVDLVKGRRHTDGDAVDVRQQM